jgi:hypothetical protein
MRFTDSRGRRWTLTRTQALYLAEGDRRRLRYGWGGLRSTLTVRLLEERGLITLARWDSPRWEITGLTHLGAEVLAAWNAKHNPLPDLPEETVTTSTDPRDIAYAARRVRGVLLAIIVAAKNPMTAAELRDHLDFAHQVQVVPDWPGRSQPDDRVARFNTTLNDLVLAGDVVRDSDGRYSPAHRRHALLLDLIERAGAGGVRAYELAAADPAWSDPAVLRRDLEIVRECGAAVRPHEHGRHYWIKAAPTDYVDVVVGYSAEAQRVPAVEADDHR